MHVHQIIQKRKQNVVYRSFRAVKKFVVGNTCAFYVIVIVEVLEIAAFILISSYLPHLVAVSVDYVGLVIGLVFRC